VLLACLLRVHAAHHLGSVRDRLLGVERALLSGKALRNQLGVLVNPHLRRRAGRTGGGAEAPGHRPRDRGQHFPEIAGGSATSSQVRV